MKQKLINNVLQGMHPFLNNAQFAQLQKVLEREFIKVEVTKYEEDLAEVKNDNIRLTELFLAEREADA